MTEVLVVGAGLAGLALAADLDNAGVAVSLLDKSRGVSGRAASKRLEALGHTLRADHGAQFFTARSPRLQSLVQGWLAAGQVRVWSHGFAQWQEGRISPAHQGNPRYVFSQGMSQMGKALLPKHLALHTQATAVRLEATPNGWKVWTAEGPCFEAPQLVLNMPAPQALKLAAPFLSRPNLESLQQVRFNPCWALVVSPLNWSNPNWVALETQHPVLAWVAQDHTKRPSGAPPVLVAHARGDWSQSHLEQSPSQVLPLLLHALQEVVGPLDVGQALAHRWRYALVTQPLEAPYLQQDRLAFCGDWCGGARIESALESGWALATALGGI